MFGIGKKKEMIGKDGKVEEKATGDEIQFDFEENDKIPFDDEEGFADEDFSGEDFVEEPPRKGLRQSLSQRNLLLGLLLLLALGGGGYYFLSSDPVPPPQPAPPVKAKAKIAVKPATPAPTASPAPAPAPAPAVKPASPTPVAAAPAKSPQPVAASPAAVVKPASTSPATKAAPVAAVPATKAAPVAAVPEAKSKVAALAPASSPAIPKPFTLSAGTFVSEKNQRNVEKTIRRLGYTPKVTSTYSMVTMTRLWLGLYDPETAEEKRRELSAKVPGLFTLKQGDQVALYAGSYQDIDQARRFADQLYLLDILVNEETVSLRMPVKSISYGSFSSREEAEKAAKRAAAAGVSAQVVKR